MKRRGFLKFLGIAPAVPLVAKAIEQSETTGVTPELLGLKRSDTVVFPTIMTRYVVDQWPDNAFSVGVPLILNRTYKP